MFFQEPPLIRRLPRPHMLGHVWMPEARRQPPTGMLGLDMSKNLRKALARTGPDQPSTMSFPHKEVGKLGHLGGYRSQWLCPV